MTSHQNLHCNSSFLTDVAFLVQVGTESRFLTGFTNCMDSTLSTSATSAVDILTEAPGHTNAISANGDMYPLAPHFAY